MDYIIFECLAERTIGLAKQEMLKDPTLTLASLRYEYGWTSNDADKMGQCVLAGHGYNVTTFNVPVTYCGTNDEIKGQYQLAIWENHADPIICGREQLGYSKIYADITDICEEEDGTYAALSSWNFEFLKLHFKMDEKPDDLSEMQKVLFDEENEGIMHYKYIPHSEAGFNKADVQYVTITPKHFLHLSMPNLCLSLNEYGEMLL